MAARRASGTDPRVSFVLFTWRASGLALVNNEKPGIKTFANGTFIAIKKAVDSLHTPISLGSAYNLLFYYFSRNYSLFYRRIIRAHEYACEPFIFHLAIVCVLFN